MSVCKLAEILNDPQQASDVQLVDVREDVEARISSLPQFQVKPLSRCVYSYIYWGNFISQRHLSAWCRKATL